MRKKVQYLIAFSNFILQIVAFSIFHSPSKHVFFRFEHDLLTKVLAAFILLMPVAFVVAGNLLERNEKYTGVYSYKVFPIVFIILLLSSWVMCVYVNAVLGPFYVEKQNWAMLALGSVLMYLANYVTALEKDNPVFKKLGIKIKNEYTFKAILRISMYGIGLEGYFIILCGALGFFYNRRLSLALMLLSSMAFAIAVIFIYISYVKMMNRRKAASRENKNKKD